MASCPTSGSLKEKRLSRLELRPCELSSGAPPIGFMTLAAGWTDGMTVQMKAAIATLVEQNPILAGTMRREGELLFVEGGVHSDFVVEISGPEDFVVPRNTTESITVLHALEARFAEKALSIEVEQIIKTEGPLFNVILMKLPKEHMIHCIEINHAIVDGASYYKILDFINCAINGRPLPELQWKAAQRSVLNNLEGYCEKDAEDFDLVSQTMVEKSAKDSPGTESARVVDIRLVDSGAVVAMKQEHLASAQADGVDISSANEVLLWDGGLLFVAMKQEHLASAQADGVDFISTNDLIMAGLMELADSGAFGGMVMNMRDRIPGTPKNIADNYLCVVCFPASAAAANPAWVRSLNKAMDHLVSEGNPPLRSEAGLMEAVLACNTVLVTSPASLTRFIEPEGTHILGHLGLPRQFTHLVRDWTSIWKVDSKGTLAVVSKHFAGTRGKDIQERISNSRIFQHLFIQKHDTKQL